MPATCHIQCACLANLCNCTRTPLHCPMTKYIALACGHSIGMVLHTVWMLRTCGTGQMVPVALTATYHCYSAATYPENHHGWHAAYLCQTSPVNKRSWEKEKGERLILFLVGPKMCWIPPWPLANACNGLLTVMAVSKKFSSKSTSMNHR